MLILMSHIHFHYYITYYVLVYHYSNRKKNYYNLCNLTMKWYEEMLQLINVKGS